MLRRMPVRFDFGTLGRAVKTPSGGVRVPAHVSRVGVFAYRSLDGGIRKEFRSPEEVFHSDALASLADAPVTDLHPKSFVTADNWKEVSKGHTNNPRQDGDKILAELVINSKDLIEKVDARDRVEVSCGYSCELDPTPGEYNGERYDARQVNIRYNHVATGPNGWGRQGSEVAIHLDHADDAIEVEREQPRKPQEAHRMETERIDGIDYKVGSPEWSQAKNRQAATATQRADAAEAEAKEAKAKADALEGERDAIKKRLDALEDPKALEARVNQRIQITDSARKVLPGDFDFTGKSDREIQVAALKADSKDFDDTGRSDEYVAGAFHGLSIRREDMSDVAHKLRQKPPETKADTKDEPPKDPRAVMIERNRKLAAGA